MRIIKIILSAIKQYFIGWYHGNKMSSSKFLDLILTCVRFHIGTTSYLNDSVFEMEKCEKSMWIKQKSFRYRYWQNRQFLAEYTSLKYDCSAELQAKRNEAYRKRYNMGEKCWVQNGVTIIAEHGHEGNISIGDNVLLNRDVDLDYTGDLRIGDGVAMAEGVKILTHGHSYLGAKKEYLDEHGHTYLSPLIIEDNVFIGIRAVIMPGVNSIGKNSIISAGSIVTRPVPPNSLVSGNPAVAKPIPHGMRTLFRVQKIE